MTTRRILSLAAVALFSACGGHALLEDTSGRFRLVARVRATDTAATRSALREGIAAHSAALLFATDSEAGAPTDGVGVPVVAIGTSSSSTTQPAVLVVERTGADVAVQLALLACSGISIPKQLPLGAEVQRSVPDARPTNRPAPGDVVIELLRQQHAAVLAIPPTTDVVFRIGFVHLDADDPWQLRVRADVEEAAHRYHQLELTTRCANGDPAKHAAIVRELAGNGCRAILVGANDPAPASSIADELREHSVALVVVARHVRESAATSCVGPDQVVLGTAAGEAAASLLPRGGAIIEVHGDPASPLLVPRRQGFAAALGLK
ncbi:MAG: substrate-binding domain-containing protein [Planctomycetes bacterium]|nr:substrate-binding domain-containing protein [Planctomycetota bacterium]